MTDTLKTILWWARHLVVLEVRLYWSLLRWLARRPDLGGPDAAPVGYARTVTPVTALWIFASAAEIPLVHVLVPWDGVRIALLIAGVWGVIWMIGLLASLHVYPHLMEASRLRIRYGALHTIDVPWEAVAEVTHKRVDLDSTVRCLQPRETDRGVDLQVAVSGVVNVHAVLREPTVVSTVKGDLEVVEVSFFADEPRPCVAAARTFLTSSEVDRRS